MIKRLGTLAALCAIASLAVGPKPALAGSQTPNLTVQTTVVTNCTALTVPTLDLGSYDPLATTANTATANFTTKCSSGDTVSFSVNNGSNYGLATSHSSNRSMSYNSNYLAYYLCPATCASDGSNDWTSTTSAETATGAGTTAASPLTFSLFARIPTLQDVRATTTGSHYTDTVQITLSY